MKPLVLIPLFNEIETIVHVLERLRECYFEDTMIIDDGSSDGSAEAARGVSDPRLLLRQHETNQGYGATLTEGFAFAIENGYSHVVTLDCDWQHEPCEVPRFLRASEKADIVSGSRYLPDSETCGAAPPSRVEINHTVTEMVNSLTGFGLTDAFCGLKCYSTSGLAQLSLTEKGYGFPLQFWIQAKARDLSVIELAVARIYTGVKRTFGGGLDDPAGRLAYYRNIIERESAQWGLK